LSNLSDDEGSKEKKNEISGDSLNRLSSLPPRPRPERLSKICRNEDNTELSSSNLLGDPTSICEPPRKLDLAPRMNNLENFGFCSNNSPFNSARDRVGKKSPRAPCGRYCRNLGTEK
jgi:hypothetical protein